MPGHSKIDKVNRIIDANINRAKEGLRVCEEIARFILNSRSLTSEFKKIRHKINVLVKNSSTSFNDLINSRNSRNDVGQNIYIRELERKDSQDILFANLQRVKESIRVLEEFNKLKNSRIAIGFKKIRYKIYEVEKKVAKRIASLPYR